MAFVTPRPRFPLVVLVTFVLFFHQQTTGVPRESVIKLQDESFQKKSKPENLLSDGSISSVTGLERKQRFCLNRLRDALSIVCSNGSGRHPLYFSPNQYVSVNQTNHLNKQRNLRSRKHLRGISSLSQPRLLLKRRSRRNIVRECCNAPCGFSDLRKYCSSSVNRASQKDRSIVDSASGSQNLETNLITPLQDQPSCFGKADCGLAKATGAPRQCVTIDELERFYLKFIQKQWRQGSLNQSVSGIARSKDKMNVAFGNANVIASPNEIPRVDTFGKTSQMVTDPNIILTKLNSLLDSNHLQDVTTDVPVVEDRDANEISEGNGSDKFSSNIMTAPPIPRLINLPRGTNDYIY